MDNHEAGTFKIEKQVPIPPVRGADNRFHRTARIMMIGDSVLLHSKKDAVLLQGALRRVKKSGTIRPEDESKEAYRLWCVEYRPGKRRGRRGPNNE